MLSSYELACGSVQRHSKNDVDIVLWSEYGVYHIRAHDFKEHKRLEWTSVGKLEAARSEYKRMIRTYAK